MCAPEYRKAPSLGETLAATHIKASVGDCSKSHAELIWGTKKHVNCKTECWQPACGKSGGNLLNSFQIDWLRSKILQNKEYLSRISTFFLHETWTYDAVFILEAVSPSACPSPTKTPYLLYLRSSCYRKQPNISKHCVYAGYILSVHTNLHTWFL